MKILILKPSSLGDVIQALPVLRLLKRRFPESEIYWWLEAGLRQLLEGDRDLTGIIPFQRQRWSSPQHWDELFQSIVGLRRARFDWVIDLQGLARSAWVSWLAAGEFTVGVGDMREGAPMFYDLAVPRPGPEAHAVDWYLEVVQRLGVPVDRDFDWLPERVDVARQVGEKWPVAGHRWILLNPGARWWNKRWPAEHFAELVRLVAAEVSGVRFAVLGSVADKELSRQIVAAAPDRCLDLTGQTSLQEMIQWVRVSELMITNDTGPVHVAAALGRPVVALYGPTNPSRTGPYGQVNRVMTHPLPCAPCMKATCSNSRPIECLLELSPRLVYDRVRSMLAV